LPLSSRTSRRWLRGGIWLTGHVTVGGRQEAGEADHDLKATPLHKRGTYRIARRHMGGLLASCCAAALACGLATTIKVLVFNDADPLPHDVLGAALTVLLSMFWLTVAAAFFVIPAVLVGYPIALVLVRGGASLSLMIVSGALLAPTVGSFATLGCVSLFIGSVPASWLGSIAFLAPAASAGGAAMAFVIARRNRPATSLGDAGSTPCR